MLVYSLNGAWHLYDANTLQPLRELNGPGGDAEPQWHPTDPKSLYWIPTNGGMVLNKLNVETNTSTVAANFAGKLPRSEEHTSELPSLMRISYAVFCLKKKK